MRVDIHPAHVTQFKAPLISNFMVTINQEKKENHLGQFSFQPHLAQAFSLIAHLRPRVYNHSNKGIYNSEQVTVTKSFSI